MNIFHSQGKIKDIFCGHGKILMVFRNHNKVETIFHGHGEIVSIFRGHIEIVNITRNREVMGSLLKVVNYLIEGKTYKDNTYLLNIYLFDLNYSPLNICGSLPPSSATELFETWFKLLTYCSVSWPDCTNYHTVNIGKPKARMQLMFHFWNKEAIWG